MEIEIRPTSELRMVDRARQDLKNIDELAESIREKGLLQPILISEDNRVLAGGRRFSACLLLGIKEIPCVVRDAQGEVDEKEVELLENLMREDLHWHEEGELIQRITDLYLEKYKGDWSMSKTAKLLGKSKGNTSMKISLVEAAKQIPALKKIKEFTHARKALEKIGTQAIVEEMREEQKERVAHGGLSIVELGDANYRVGDSFEGLQELAALDRSPVYLMEVDPPYDVSLGRATRYKATSTAWEDLGVGDYHELDIERYQELAKLCYEGAGTDAWLIWWFASIYQEPVRTALTAAGWSLDPVPALWFKGGPGNTNQPERYLGRVWEPFFIGWKGDPLLAKRGRPNVFHFELLRGKEKWHPAQRPPELIQEILLTFAFPGAVVCSPFLGSGSTLIACYREQMKGFGWDLSQQYKDAFLIDLERHFPKGLDNE